MRPRYERGLSEIANELETTDRMLVLFLGSNIGTFDPPGASAFLCGVRHELRHGDSLLVGADLVKAEEALRLADDDPLGVTAAFNRNLLVRINRELGGDFDLDQFTDQTVWNAEESRVEMYLAARRAPHVHVEAAGIEFSMAEGEECCRVRGPLGHESVLRSIAAGPVLQSSSIRTRPHDGKLGSGISVHAHHPVPDFD